MDEDSEARGPGVKELRSGAPKFPTISSLAIPGTLALNEEMELLWPFLKNTWRRLRINRVIRMARNLQNRIDGCLEMTIEWNDGVRVYEKGDDAIYRAALQKVMNKRLEGAFRLYTYGSHL